MNKQYIKAIELLCQKLDIETPKDITEVTSLRVGEQMCHITENPSGRLVMFSLIDFLENENALSFLEMNVFSQQEQKPVIGFDKDWGGFILWNHQPLFQADATTLYNQLDLLSSHYDIVLEANNPENRTAEDDEAITLSPLVMRV